MSEFVDPRTNPQPGLGAAVAEMAESIEQLEGVHRLCREGRIYEVEDWIKAGRPLQFVGEAKRRGPRIGTALEIALETGQHALALLLLCNGYRLDLEPRSPFDLALRARRWDLVDLLFDWGADPSQVDRYSLFESYNSALFERFYAAGVDLTERHAMADTLSYHTSNKPLFGFVKRHRESDPRIQVELNIALGHHVQEGNLKGVHLCVWAGADPHVPTPDLQSTHLLEPGEEEECDRFIGWSAVEAAVLRGHTELLPILKPNPSRDKFEELYQSASDAATVEALARLAPPRDVGAIIRHQVFYLDDRWPGSSTRRPVDVLTHVFKVGGRWVDSSADEIAVIRRHLLKASDCTFVEIMKMLAHDDHCSPTVLQELGRTPSIRQRMAKVGLLPSPRRDNSRLGYDPHRVSGARNVLSKFGITIPKGKPQLPRVVNVGRWHPEETTIRLDRQAMYERVWAGPVESIAKSWGLSGRGLAKVCRRLRVPVPPRGYWAKIQHGQKQPRPPLRDAPGGNPVEIVIHVPPKSS
jgi:hypothetical protein